MCDSFCNIKGCKKKITRPSFGWCETHYYRNRKYGSPNISKRKNAGDVKIDILKDYAEIHLTNGGKSKIDIEDVEKVSGICWSATTKDLPYVRGYVNKKSVLLHRYLMGSPKGLCVDHINHDITDNRKKNLRICSIKQNLWNLKSKGGTSKYRGVSWSKERKMWKASICKDGKRKDLGFFKNEIEALECWNKHATKMFGEYAIIQAIDFERSQ